MQGSARKGKTHLKLAVHETPDAMPGVSMPVLWVKGWTRKTGAPAIASGDLVTVETGKAETFMALFASVFTNKVTQTFQRKVEGRGEQSAVIEDQVRVGLRWLLSSQGWSDSAWKVVGIRGCPCSWRKANIVLFSRKGQSRTRSVPRKIMEWAPLEHVCGHRREKRAAGSSQHGLKKGKPCWTNLTATGLKIQRELWMRSQLLRPHDPGGAELQNTWSRRCPVILHFTAEPR